MSHPVDGAGATPPLQLGSLDVTPVLFLIGLLVTGLGAAMLAPAILDWAGHDQEWRAFLVAAGLTVGFGALLAAATWRRPIRLSRRQGFLLTALAWVTLPLFGSLPFLFAQTGVTPADAFFESVSGLTTTGSTIFTHLDQLPPGLLFWRAVLQWIGGIGIIGMAIAFLPMMRVGGMQLFRMESSDTSEQGLTRIGLLGLSISGVYLAITLAMILAYLVVGLPLFDAVCLAFATVSTGGFATTDASLGQMPPLGLWLATLGMIASALPFVLYVRALRGRPGILLTDPQVRGLLILLVLSWLILAGHRTLTAGVPFFDALTAAAVNVTSIVTTTGFASEDYTLWGDFPVLAFFLLTFAGGCTGSTSGGLKMFRFQVAAMVLRAHIRRRYLPHAVLVVTFGDRTVDADVAASVILFFFVMGAATATLALSLTILGLDWVTALSGAATALCNVGPGLGPIIGPAGTFDPLPDAAKVTLALGMLLGRLEFFTLLVLLSRAFWRP